MSIPRIATWGGAGGLLFSGLFTVVAQLGWGVFVIVGPVFGLAGAACAAGALALARRAVSEPLEDGGAVEQVGLTDDEVRELLGGPE